VTSHLSIYSYKKTHGPVIPLATSDLVLSPDLLEGARAIDYLSATGLMIVDEEFQVPLSILLDKGIEKPVTTQESLRLDLKNKLGDQLVLAPLKKMSFERFQRPVYASAMILGIAYQAGRLPFSLDDLKLAFNSALPKLEFEPNWEAFQMGRDWFLNRWEIQQLSVFDDKKLWEKSVSLVAYPWQRGQRFVDLWNTYNKMFGERFTEIPSSHIRQYLHDIIVFDQGKFLGQFYEMSLQLRKKYSTEDLSVALRVLAKTFWIKDEVFVSHLMISPLKAAIDQERYGLLGSSFEIVHINRPAFDLFGKKIEFDFSPKRWMLKIMRHLRSLRLLMPEWHKKEKEISQQVRKELLEGFPPRHRLLELDNIKGYREVRYKAASLYLGKKHV